MKIVNRTPQATADISGARGTAFRELRVLLVLLVVLVGALYAVVGLVTDVVVSRISFQTEAKLFAAFQRDAVEADAEQLSRLQTILEKLTADAAVAPLPYRLSLIRNENPNAFAFPGGGIAVTTALLDALEDDVELAFVLGHELGHFKNRDHLRGMGRALGLGIVYAVLFRGELGSNSGSSIGQTVLQRTYSRRQEERADRFGVALVYRIYGKTRGVDRLFRILREGDKTPCWAYMLSTHPAPEDRIRALKEYADGLECDQGGDATP